MREKEYIIAGDKPCAHMLGPFAQPAVILIDLWMTAVAYERKRGRSRKLWVEIGFAFTRSLDFIRYIYDGVAAQSTRIKLTQRNIMPLQQFAKACCSNSLAKIVGMSWFNRQPKFTRPLLHKRI